MATPFEEAMVKSRAILKASNPASYEKVYGSGAQALQEKQAGLLQGIASGGGGGSTAVAAPARAQIDQAYQSNFGRPAEKAGLDYWEQKVKENPGMDINAALRAGAAAMDTGAASDIRTDKLTYPQTWTGDVNAEDEAKYYDAERNMWVVDPAKTPPQFYQGPTAYGDVATERGIKSGLEYVDADKSTVAGQLRSLFADDSPYLQQARLGAERQAAGRGMLNTSMAAGAGESAAIQAGLPIAQQDAGTYAAAQGRQQEGEITSNIQAEGYNAQGRLQSQGASQRMDQSRLEGDINMQLQDAGYQNQQELQQAAIAGDKAAMELQATINTARDTFAAAQATLARFDTIQSTLTNALFSATDNILNNMDIGDVTAAMAAFVGMMESTQLGKSIFNTNIDLVGEG